MGGKVGIRDKRAETLSKAYTNNPIRFRNISPDPVSVPSFATINYPNDKKEEILEQLDKTDTNIYKISRVSQNR